MLKGRQLPFSNWLSFICTGVTFANFVHDGNLFISNSLCKISAKMSALPISIFVAIFESWDTSRFIVALLISIYV